MSARPPSTRPETTAAVSISEFAPPRRFLLRFQRWEWMLVALILVVLWAKLLRSRR